MQFSPFSRHLILRSKYLYFMQRRAIRKRSVILGRGFKIVRSLLEGYDHCTEFSEEISTKNCGKPSLWVIIFSITRVYWHVLLKMPQKI
jgi:hypothetical protein